MAKEKDELDTKSLSLADLVEALRAATGNDDATMAKRAKFEAEAYERLEKKENIEHPHVSVYSYPEGDIANPKPKLKCQMFWVGYDEQAENLTPDEIDLFNVAEPGEFIYHKTDGSTEKLTVTSELSASGKVSKMHFHFPCRGDNKHNQPGKTAMLREIYLGAVSDEAALLAQLAALRAELAQAKVSA